MAVGLNTVRIKSFVGRLNIMQRNMNQRLGGRLNATINLCCTAYAKFVQHEKFLRF